MALHGEISSRYPYFPMGGRLSAVANDPEGDASTASSNVFYIPYEGNILSFYDSARLTWIPKKFPQLTIPLTGLLAATIYDLFLAINPAGGFLYKTIAWASSSARTIALTLVDGINVKSDETNYLWLGSFRTASAAQILDFWENRCIFSAFNRVRREMYKAGTAQTTNYTLANSQGTRVAANNTAHQIPFLIGANTDFHAQANWQSLQYFNSATNTLGNREVASLAFARFSISLNTVTNRLAADVSFINSFPTTTNHAFASCIVPVSHNRIKTIGYNQLIPVEQGSGTTNTSAICLCRWQDLRGMIIA